VSKSLEDICDEIHQNAQRDRKRLEDYLDVVGKSSISDPELAAALADSVVAVSEALTKNNAQLVELAKVKLKHIHITSPDDKFRDEEIDSVYEDISDEDDDFEEEPN
jgi:hypothetical protein